MKRLLSIVILALLASAQPALAWGEVAHRLIARIALAEMSPAARTAATQLLAQGNLLQTPSCPLDTLEDAAVWPDCARGLGERFAFASEWHFQNIEVCQSFALKGTCPGGNCLTMAIRRQLAILARHDAPLRDRVQALAFVTHFVGDLHQPLHVSDREDRGGNAVSVHFRGVNDSRMNLHRLWDRELAVPALGIAPAITAGSISSADMARWQQGDIIDWTRESWDIARTMTYGALPGAAAQCPAAVAAEVSIPDTYAARATPIIRTQIERAGVRLALLLDAALR